MKIRVVATKELSPELISAWDAMQRGNPAYASPCFRPEFTQAVAAVRDDVQVAVLEDRGVPVGFLPFHRTFGRIGWPIGINVAERHAVITTSGIALNALELIDACGLRAWRFDRLNADQTAFQPFHSIVEPAPFIDWHDGFDAYYRGKENNALLKEAMRKSRKMGRELGDVRLDTACHDAKVLEELLEWKAAQCRRNGSACGLVNSWLPTLFTQLLNRDDPRLRGFLCSLYAGRRRVAMLFGCLSNGVLQGSVVAYDPEVGRYSPGIVLIVELARAAMQCGLRRFEMGRGNQQWKRGLMTGATLVAEGTVSASPLDRWLWQGLLRTREWGRKTPLRFVARRVKRAVWLLGQCAGGR